MKLFKYLIFSLVILMMSCADLLETELPSDEVEKEDALTTKQDLQELLNSSYDVVANNFGGKAQRLSEIMADNLFLDGNSGFLIQVYNRASDFFNSDVADFYNGPYIAITRANTIIENLDLVDLTEEERNRFEGEARFIRAISHFELVRLFAQPYGFTENNSHLGIVLKTSSDIEPKNRATVSEVYDQVITDLENSADLLPTENGNYATTYAAQAFLAKVHFQMNDFANAAQYASNVIENGTFTFSEDVNNRFSTEVSSEAIFSIISTNMNDDRASFFDDYNSLNSNAETLPFLLPSLDYFNFLRGNPNDLRSEWVEPIGQNRVFTKFNLQYFNVTVTSLTEMMLIAAESYGELDQNLPKAIEYLNLIKDRAEISLLDAGSSAGLIISEARNERRKEFGGEGLRLHELKRRGVKGENVLIRNAPWDCDGMVLQFPASEIAVEGFTLNPEGGCN